MSVYTCQCKEGSLVDVSDCTFCNSICDTQHGSSMSSCVVQNNAVIGFTLSMLLLYFLVSVIVFLLMIWFSVVVVKKCNGRPPWLTPLIITLLVLWFILGWVPGVGVAFFVILLVILAVFYNRCDKKKKNS